MTIIREKFLELIIYSKAMFKQAITLILLSTFLGACASGPDGYFKKSANNKVFDRQGFKGGKRSPLYNKKYVSQAKKNIINNNLDEDIDYDKDDEFPDAYRENIEMYKSMIEEDLEKEKRKKNKSSWWWNKNNKSYPSVSKANNELDPELNAQNLELREELENIKKMLKDAKREMASYKCPTAEVQEKKHKEAEEMNLDELPRPTLNLRIPQDLKQKTMEIHTPDHVHSI